MRIPGYSRGDSRCGGQIEVSQSEGTRLTGNHPAVPQNLQPRTKPFELRQESVRSEAVTRAWQLN